MQRIHQDIYVSIIMFLVSIFLYIQTLDMNEDAVMAPRYLLYLLVFFAVLIVIGGIRKTKKMRAEVGDHNEMYDGEEEPLTGKLLKSPMITLLAVIAYAVVIKFLGFFPATVLFIAGFLWALKVKDWKSYAFTIVGLNLFIYLVFILQLNVQLPKGILFE
ncbi:tripartite tricarboxylate transporter TctB family protein [Virgibacillus ndiopensis]|uniref:tripartite tricarboxylate transporter TctB family protein n=1 Tax=Virgibacillus ndiopensis TaxID=2004408 RepID=UPI000C07FFBD|nr:tripartite tricarboxylate transporter TctB family protein [Virgibacillus ndiopensis]